MNIERRMSPNFNQGRRGHVPDMIVCHITEGAFAGAVNWLANPASGVSAHFVVARDGRITQMVEIADMAWANGTAAATSSNLWNGHATLPVVRTRNINANLYTISIEHEGRFAETKGALAPQQLDATVWLIGHIREEVRRLFGTDIPITRQNIVGHHEITPRTRPNCPGAQFPFDEIIARLTAPPAPITPPDPTPTDPNAPQGVSNFAREAWEWGIKNGLTDGTNPRNTATREQLMTILHRYHNLS
ncbi:MAG: N-acetylmuramoyl-L-alanine amidase [Defluviitaleaceae bacterium]|nr:N-acetylmuramoyl-L-alanine amidase [Defluviitaleaceae bacterium]